MAATASSPSMCSISRARRLPTSCWIRCRRRAAARRPRRGRTCSTASASSPRTISSSTDRLTLNLGLRWAYTSPFVEKDDRQANFDLTNAAQLLAGQNGNSRALYDAYYNGWEPRIGVAYRPGDRWVFRGGYGITQYMEGTGANLRLPLNPAVLLRVGSPVRHDQRGREHCDRLRGAAAARSAVGPAARLGSEAPAAVHAAVELSSSSTCWDRARRSTSATSATGRPSWSRRSTATSRCRAPAIRRRGCRSSSAGRSIRSTRDSLSISTTASRGRSNYNGLQSTFKQRLWKGLDFVANYTWSKSMANNSGYFGNAGVAGEGAYPMNSYDIEANYGPAAYDARHIVSVAGSYDLPFGRERQFGSNWNGAGRCGGSAAGRPASRLRRTPASRSR